MASRGFKFRQVGGSLPRCPALAMWRCDLLKQCVGDHERGSQSSHAPASLAAPLCKAAAVGGPRRIAGEFPAGRGGVAVMYAGSGADAQTCCLAIAMARAIGSHPACVCFEFS